MSTTPSGFERAHPFIQLQPQDFVAILAPIMQVTAEELEIIALPGLVNSSYHVKYASRDLLVRLISGDLNGYLKEFNVLTRYAELLPLPKPLNFQLSSPASRGYSVAIHEWIDGIILEEFLTRYPEQTAQVAQLVGHTLAQFARLPFVNPGFLSNQLSLAQPIHMDRVGYLDYMNGLLSESLAAERLEKIREPLWQYVSFHAKSLDAIPSTYNLVHGNFRRNNILVSPRPEGVVVVGVLGWEFAMAWTSLFDISQLLESPFPKHQEFERELVQAYVSRGGHMPQEWSSIKNLLQLLSWCDQLARPASLPAQQQAAIEKIKAIIRS